MRVNKNTGYPHIDKPWLKYYDEEFLKKPLPKMSIYDYMKQHAQDYVDYTAITYYGNEISYGQLYENIDRASKVLTSLGVKAGDRILYLMPNIPETAYLFYGTSQIGAVSNYVDPRPDSIDLNVSAKKILDLIKEESINHIISLDMCYVQMLKPIENELKELGIDNITIVSTNDSMNLPSKLNYLQETLDFEGFTALRKIIKINKSLEEQFECAKQKSPLKLLNYKTLLNQTQNILLTPAKYTEGRLSVITHTSGTSGMPKPIPLTDDNLNAYVHQTYGSNMLMEPGDKVLHILPYFAAYGIVDVAHAGLVHANNLIQVPMFSPKNLGKLIRKHKPQTIIGVPSWFINIMNSRELKKENLSFLKMIIYGGDSMEIEDEEKINQFLKGHNCKHPLTKGHGMSEIAGCGSYATNEYNIPSSMGIPMPNTTYAIVNPETKKPIKFRENLDTIEGEIAISSDSVTSGHLDNLKIAKKINLDGKEFILTNDIATMDKNGILYFQTRADRTFTRYDGFKIKPYKIEQIIKEYYKVKDCVITPYFDEKLEGNMPLASIILETEDYSEDEVQIVKNILTECFINNKETSSRQIPSKFRIIDSLPLSKNGKIDYNNIDSSCSDIEISVSFDETNISFENINVEKSKQKTLKR